MKTIKTAFRALLVSIFALALFPAVHANDWDEQPSVKKSVAPDNPSGVQGMVMATIEIDEKGNVVNATIAKSTDAALEPHVIDAVQQWLFNPAKKGGSPIACKINVPFKFKG